jgi:glycerol-3-phosphate dehydrogenase
LISNESKRIKIEIKRTFEVVLQEQTATPITGSPGTEVTSTWDVLVVGGGINGTGLARDLAGRGWRVMLVEQHDLAAHTSSSSTKLIHGGLRYLEHFEFSLVRKALQEREGLMRSAPHIMWPLRFVMPHVPATRPAWLIRCGLFLYDHLARRDVLEGSSGVNLRLSPLGAPLQDQYTQGFVYSDGWVDDARLVVLNAVDAAERGAEVLTHTRCTRAQRDANGWTATLQTLGSANDGLKGGVNSTVNGQTRIVRARALVNAAGPWAEAFLRGVARPASHEALATKQLRLVKGSHIVVPRLFEHDHAYIFQNPDKRIIFAIPYEDRFTLIGTTDVEIKGEPLGAQADDNEVAYLCEQVNRYFNKRISKADVVWRYVGVRPLLDDHAGDPSAVTRDYVLETETSAAPLLSIWGGKITTFRKLAEEAANEVGKMLAPQAPRPAWTQSACLPGGNFSAWIGAAQHPATDFDKLCSAVLTRHPWLPAPLIKRLARAYGSRIDTVLGQATCLADLGDEIAPGLYTAELHHLRKKEWALTGEDVLWRRSKLGLHFTAAQRERVDQWMAGTLSGAACN